MSLYLWNGVLLIRTWNGVTGLATSAACCCGDLCQTCCGGSYDGPVEFRLGFTGGGFSGGEHIAAPDCDCCDCVESSLSNPVVLSAIPGQLCKWSGVVDVCVNGPDGWFINPGQVILELSCAVVGGQEVITATLSWEIHQGSFATWVLEGFDCQKTEESPNLLTNTSADGCDAVPTTATVWTI